ncbi:hypothetical protein Pst134EA_011911 [Puccinia striiformis f. sp. tritici]|uniref:hypothetical protein n=1 Tax=Puccinia striiformis f. sp. tritici TaxID=168172 RepID=UPI00200877B9|nr:hypothetical protein Pst134EA_011911 [Puccinia striiformis f. sp. tritici]KAH9468288.1 hypothetical protein Pst134EA_011911 [Puccinia striiformis f. sp. tritici]
MFYVHRLHITEIQLISSGRPMVRCSLHVRIRLQTSRILWSHCARGNDVVCAGHIASLGWADHATSMPLTCLPRSSFRCNSWLRFEAPDNRWDARDLDRFRKRSNEISFFFVVRRSGYSFCRDNFR